MTSTTTTTPAVDTEGSATRVGPMHEAFAAYLNENFGAGITAQQIFLVTSKRKAFRSTDAYRVDVAMEKVAAHAAAAAEKEAKREKAAADRKAKAQEKASAKAADDTAATPEPAKAAAPVQKTTPAAKAPAAKPATKKATASTPKQS